MDVTDMVDYNIEVLNKNDLENSFFLLSSSDPTHGFAFDATKIPGHTYRPDATHTQPPVEDEALRLRLVLGSHLAFHIRHQLEEQKGYTSTVGISTSKMLSKLVGNVHKPKSQTTLMPPYRSDSCEISNVQTFLDDHDIGKIPWIGFKLAQKLREHVLDRPAAFQAGLVYGATREGVTVKHVRQTPDLDPEVLEKVLSGPGAPHGIGRKVWSLIHGIDDSEVSLGRSVPRQISIEDSYVRLDTMEQVLQQMHSLSSRLIERMRTDLTDVSDEPIPASTAVEPIRLTTTILKWIAHPNTLRLTTRPRPPLNADGTRTRTFKRISRSSTLPSSVFSLTASVDSLADKLVKDALVPLFRKLHPDRSGWNLSLINVAVTGMEGEDRARGGNIGSMFKKMSDDEEVSKEVDDMDIVDSESITNGEPTTETDPDMSLEALRHQRDTTEGDDSYSDSEWHDGLDPEDEGTQSSYSCSICGVRVPRFASAAHERFHSFEK